MQIVSACLARDLAVYRLTFKSLRQHLPEAELHVVTRSADFELFRRACGPELHLWDEAELVPGMTLHDLKQMPLPFSPRAAGWYFQQFLKFSFLNVSNADEHFLIWDADTILLRPLDFFDQAGRPYYTKAKEHHHPYFETFECLFGSPANREFSFISQHQVINKRVLREMLELIETRHPTSKNWAWAIMENLKGDGSNLFSEYETYGHYLKWKHAGSFSLRELPWTRNGEKYAGYPPDASKLPALGEQYCFAAFEAFFSLRNRLTRYLRRLFRKPVTSDYA